MAASPTVLVVDDEQPIRALLARWITQWDYRVRDAAGRPRFRPSAEGSSGGGT